MIGFRAKSVHAGAPGLHPLMDALSLAAPINSCSHFALDNVVIWQKCVAMNLGTDLPSTNGPSLSTIGRREAQLSLDLSADVRASARADLAAALQGRYA